MIDLKQTISSLKQIVEQLDLRENNVSKDELTLEAKKKQLVLEREKLTARESAFLDKSSMYGKEVDRVEKMLKLAKSIKAQSDDDRDEMKIQQKALDSREDKIEDLEKKQKQLKAKEKLIEVRESDIEEREIIVEKDKQNARDKQRDLDIRSKSLKKKQDRLQAQINAQN